MPFASTVAMSVDGGLGGVMTAISIVLPNDAAALRVPSPRPVGRVSSGVPPSLMRSANTPGLSGGDGRTLHTTTKPTLTGTIAMPIAGGTPPFGNVICVTVPLG
jgi:hypothetical protein